MTIRDRVIRKLGHRQARICAYAMASMLLPTPALAQWVVNDVTHMAIQAAEIGEQATRWVATAEQYKRQIDSWTEQAERWKMQLISLKGIHLKAFALDSEFAEIPEDFGVDATCQHKQSVEGNITAFLSNFSPNKQANIREEQGKLCVAIVRTKNRQYNDTAKYLNALKEASTSIDGLQKTLLTEVEKSPGKLQAVAADIARLNNHISHSREQWESNIKQNGMQVRSLEMMQGMYARLALLGKQDEWGKIVNAIALKAALEMP